MSKKTIIMGFSAAVLLGLGLASCGPTTDSTESSETPISSSLEDTTTYTVSFYANGAAFGNSQTVKKGAKATRPATDPTKDADAENTYTFDGWYLTGATTAFDFNTAITSDLDLYAKFTATPIVHDVSIWVWGGTSDTTYITSEEATRLETAISGLSALEQKSVKVKYFTGISNDDFNRGVQEATAKPDVLVSGANLNNGDYAITMDAETPKAKMGLGWFESVNRYVGVPATVSDAHYENAKLVYNTLKAEGPDFFSLDKTSASLTVGETLTLTVTADAGKVVTWSTEDEAVATVSNGTITAVATGTTNVVAQLGFYKVKVAITVTEKAYDLVVWVNAGTSNYIKETESDAMKVEVVKALGTDNINWRYSAKGDKTFDEEVNASEVDLVVSSSNLDGSDKDYRVTWKEGYGKTKVGAGWFENTSRYFGIPSVVKADHLEKAIAAYNLIKNVGPNYKVTLSSSTETLTVGDTLDLTATYYGAGVTWASDNTSVATVENGKVTAVAAGEAKITATDAAGNVAECVITVIQGEIKYSYDLRVVINTDNDGSYKWMTEEKVNHIKEEFAKTTAAAGKNIDVVALSNLNVAGVAAHVNEQTTENVYDVAIGRSALGTNNDSKGIFVEGGYSAIDASWGYSSGYVGRLVKSPEVHNDLAEAFISFVKAADPSAAPEADPVSLSASTASIKVGETVTLTATGGEGEYSWASDNTEVATVEAGVVTGVKEGTATITVTAKDGSSATCVVTVAAADPVGNTESENTLHVWMYTAATPSTYLTNDEVTAIKAAIDALAQADGKTAVYHMHSGTKADGLFSAINNNTDFIADLVMGAGTNTTVANIPNLDGDSVKKIDASWASEGKRYVGAFANSDTKELALSVIDMLAAAKTAE